MKKISFWMALALLAGCSKPSVPYRDLNSNGKMDVYEDGSQSIERRVEDLLSQMTLEEKIGLVVGMGMKMPGVAAAGAVGETEDKVPGAAGTTFPIARLGIPSIILADGPAGLRIQPRRKTDSTKTFYCTAFPVGTLLASSWDTTLVKNVGQVFGNEVKEYGVDIILAPALNIHRNPLGGRNFEYYSEDPQVSGKMAAAMVNGIESNGVGTSIKHFAANNQETNRMLVNTIVSERTLREIYLKGFQIAVKNSQPRTVMSSYNKINEVSTSESYDLITTILRKEWGFNGVVVSDWFGGTEAVAQMKAGNDLLMPGTPDQSRKISEASHNGGLDAKVLDENTKRILGLIFQSLTFNEYKFSNDPDLKAHALVARTAAAEGMVLLKNEKESLPFANSIKSVAAFGNTSYDFISGGSGSGDVNEAYTISLVQGLETAGYTVSEKLKKSYEEYLEVAKAKRPKPKFFFELVPPVDEMGLSTAVISAQAKDADVAIITIGRNSGEFQDRKLQVDYYLNKVEKDLIKNVANAFHAKGKKVIVLLNVGGVIEIASWRNDVDAILLAWQGGQESGHAVADVLSGKVNPSGKLATTFPMDYKDVPSSKNFPGKNLSEVDIKTSFGMVIGKVSEVTYEEGIYVGYRYYNTFKVKPAHEFGFGLSYTQFAYGDLKLSDASFNGKMTATVTITNQGKVPGKEVVQLYLSAPAKSLNKPSEELKGFAKTDLLEPGKSQTLSFDLYPADLASFDTTSSSWVAEAGKYTVKIAASSMDFRQMADFQLPADLAVEKTNKALAPLVEIKELSSSN